MSCVGNRQEWEALDAHEATGAKGPLPQAEVRERGIIATRQLAKRQITWLRSMPQRQVTPADKPLALNALLRQVDSLLRDLA